MKIGIVCYEYNDQIVGADRSKFIAARMKKYCFNYEVFARNRLKLFPLKKTRSSLLYM